MLKIAVFVSGRGSNLNAIIKSIGNKEINAELKAIVSDKIDCPAFQFAEADNIPTYRVAAKSKDHFITYEELSKIFDETGIELIVLAGFLKKIPNFFVDKYPNKIINIHPALLPSFGGKGMFGMNVHRAVYNKSCQVSGATIHFVNKVYDNGKIIAQETVDISNVNSPEDISERVLKVEHKILPFVIGKFSEDKIVIHEDRVRILK